MKTNFQAEMLKCFWWNRLHFGQGSIICDKNFWLWSKNYKTHGRFPIRKHFIKKFYKEKNVPLWVLYPFGKQFLQVSKIDFWWYFRSEASSKRKEGSSINSLIANQKIQTVQGAYVTHGYCKVIFDQHF